jgi:hypothetical protein
MSVQRLYPQQQVSFQHVLQMPAVTMYSQEVPQFLPTLKAKPTLSLLQRPQVRSCQMRLQDCPTATVTSGTSHTNWVGPVQATSTHRLATVSDELASAPLAVV